MKKAECKMKKLKAKMNCLRFRDYYLKTPGTRAGAKRS
jgi:hypothetical protein